MLRFAALAASVAALATVVAGEAWTPCHPMKASCPPVPGLNKEDWSWDFSSGQAPSDWNVSMGNLDAGGRLRLENINQGPTLISTWYILYGRVEAKFKAAPGAGIITAFTLLSWSLDEIDWELVGADNSHVQSNYYGKGFEGTWDRGKTHDISNPQSVEHTYAIDWTAERIQWILDGKVIRTLYPGDHQGTEYYPQTPMGLRIGSWVVGRPDNSQGNIEWGGGLADFSKGPFDMFVSSVTVKNYNPAENYVFTDKSANAKGVQIIRDGKAVTLENPESKGTSSSSDSSSSGPSTAPPTNDNSVGANTATNTTAPSNTTTLTPSTSTQPSKTQSTTKATTPANGAVSSMQITFPVVGTTVLALFAFFLL